MKRDDAGFPLEFVLPAKDAIALAEGAERCREEKMKSSSRFVGRKSQVPVSAVVNKRWVAK